MTIKTSDLVGRLVSEPRFSEAVKKDVDVVAAALDLTDDQTNLLKKIAANPDMPVAELAKVAGGSGHGLFAGG